MFLILIDFVQLKFIWEENFREFWATKKLIDNKQNAYLALKIVEIIGEDEPYQLDSETIYFITNLLSDVVKKYSLFDFFSK